MCLCFWFTKKLTSSYESFFCESGFIGCTARFECLKLIWDIFFMNWTMLVVFSLLRNRIEFKEPVHMSHLFGSQAVLVVLYVFDSLEITSLYESFSKWIWLQGLCLCLYFQFTKRTSSYGVHRVTLSYSCTTLAVCYMFLIQ